jgi:hypothetical protein
MSLLQTVNFVQNYKVYIEIVRVSFEQASYSRVCFGILFGFSVCVCVCVCVCARVRVRARVRMHMIARICACIGVCNSQSFGSLSFTDCISSIEVFPCDCKNLICTSFFQYTCHITVLQTWFCCDIIYSYFCFC